MATGELLKEAYQAVTPLTLLSSLPTAQENLLRDYQRS